MKIALIDTGGVPVAPLRSGLSDVVWDLAHHFSAIGDEVHVIAPYLSQPDCPPEIHVHCLQALAIERRNIIGHTLLALRARRVVKSIPGIDVVFAPEYLSTAVISTLSSIPVVLITPGNIYERLQNGNPMDRFSTEVLKIAARLSARNCALIDAISHDMAWWWHRTGAPRERITVIPHGIDTKLFRPILHARSTLGLGEDANIVLYLGRLSPEKNSEATACTS